MRNAPPIVLHQLDTPTICALNGGAAGYGLDLALGCDIRIMAQSAKLAAAYKAYVDQHGPVNRRANAALVGEMPDGGLLLALETCNAVWVVGPISVTAADCAHATKFAHPRAENKQSA